MDNFECREITDLESVDIENMLTVCYGCILTMKGEYPDRVKYNKTVMLDTLKRVVKSDKHSLIAAYESGNLVGLIGTVIVSYPHSEQLRGHVMFLYILPGYRNGEYGSTMVSEAERWAISKGAVEITAGDVGIDLKMNDNSFSQSLWDNRGFWYTKKF